MCRVSIVGVSDKASVDRRGQTNRALRNQLISPSWVFLNSGVNPTVFMCGTETLCKPLQLPPSSTHPFIDWYSQPYWSHEEGTRFSRRPRQLSAKKKSWIFFPIACQCTVNFIHLYFLLNDIDKALPHVIGHKGFCIISFVAIYYICFSQSFLVLMDGIICMTRHFIWLFFFLHWWN